MFKCATCSKVFAKNRHLTVHSRTHREKHASEDAWRKTVVELDRWGAADGAAAPSPGAVALAAVAVAASGSKRKALTQKKIARRSAKADVAKKAAAAAAAAPYKLKGAERDAAATEANLALAAAGAVAAAGLDLPASAGAMSPAATRAPQARPEARKKAVEPPDEEEKSPAKKERASTHPAVTCVSTGGRTMPTFGPRAALHKPRLTTKADWIASAKARAAGDASARGMFDCQEDDHAETPDEAYTHVAPALDRCPVCPTTQARGTPRHCDQPGEPGVPADEPRHPTRTLPGLRRSWGRPGARSKFTIHIIATGG